MTIPRPEHPRPQFVRADWLCLNGEWSCEIDQGRSGIARGLQRSTGFATPITVPFCPESRLSGIGLIDERCIVGKVLLRVFPFDKITAFDNPFAGK